MDKPCCCRSPPPVLSAINQPHDRRVSAEALRTLPEDKRTIILLHYFSGMTDVEIGKKFGIPRSTVQYRRTSTFEQLRRYLEERAYDDEEL